ncbi:BTAD domain-containing putative transcriptional regulator [Aquisalibacillus elongatus]|uniref:Transcriptional regulator n=1 Tax=Aquisalibacillus elongatus TaxID=485577 RepID=A0A3N5AZU7_9BACI|nr:BTAD domain-containing putative transcriptional regulator [Aquisalibacillus elongatus]RPF50604.1 transcriptional regulator [Aquisalibacillus elongatus]
MSNQVPILESQFSPPVVKDRYIQRVNLHKKMQLIPSYPVTLIYSSAGYGKTMGLSSYVQYAKQPVCWLTITEYDQDFLSFMTKFIHSIQKTEPDFGVKLLKSLKDYHYHVREHEVWSMMTDVVNELELLGQDLILILDDAHHLMHAHSINKFLQLLTQHLPENIHYVLTARSKPNWSSLSRLKVKNELLEIEQKDLALSLDEVTHFIQDIHEIDLNDDDLKQIYDLTEGWPIACSMMVQQLNMGQSISSLIQMKQDGLTDLIKYMQEEVFLKQPSIVQKFLEQTSVLESITVEASDRLLRINSSQQMLEDLEEQNLFIHQIDHGTFRFHPIFKLYLENRLRYSNYDEYEFLHREAAYYFEETQDLSKSIYHHLQIKQYRVAAKILSDYGQVMLKEGKLDRMATFLEQIPEANLVDFPILKYFEGELLRYRAKYEAAEECYNSAIELADDDQNLYVLSMAFEGKARIYLDTIRPDQADHILRKAIEYREPLDVKNEEKARLYHMLGENLLNLGYANKAEFWLDKAKAFQLREDESNLEARIYLRTGRLYQARQFLMDKKEQLAKQELDHLPQSYRETDILLSIVESFMGNAEDGKTLAEQGLQLGIENESLFIEACGWMRMGHAVQLIPRYDRELSVQCYEHSLELMDQLNISRLKAEPYMGLCMLYGLAGEYEKAYHAGQMGLRETELVKDMWLSAVIRLCISIASVHCKRYDYALESLEETRHHFEACEDDYGLMIVAFWKAYLAFETNDDETFNSEIREFLRRLQTGSYDYFLKKRTYFGPIDLQLMAPLLHQARTRGIYETYVTRMIYELGFGDLERHPGYTLRIKALGEFKLFVANEQVNDSDWSRAKSKELLELLITNRHTTMTKEEIFDELWPDQDETAANKSFKVTLNGLLKILEPHRKAREDSFFILRSGSSYRLNPQSGYELDIHLFEDFIQSGLDEGHPEKSKELLLRALKLYEGDYLSNHRPVDWLIHERERLQVLFLRGAEKLAQVSVRLEDYHTCIHWCQEILSRDQTWEEAYRLLMYCYYQQNNRPQAIKWYRRCEEILEKELGIEPMKTTQDMYDMVMEFI